jgi:hypothetical protein
VTDKGAEAGDPDLDLAAWLASLDRWWKQTGNPLYAWEAVARCLNAAPPAPIPEWCLPYLAEVARNITDLTWQVARGQTTHKEAAKTIGEALRVVRQGANAFAQVQKDRHAMRYALDAKLEPKTGGDLVTIVVGHEPTTTETWAGSTIRRIKKDRNVATDHAAKGMLRRGRRLVVLDRYS